MKRVLLALLLVFGLFLAAAGCGGTATETPTDPVPPPNGQTGTLYESDSPAEE